MTIRDPASLAVKDLLSRRDGSGLLWFVLHIIPVVSLFAPVYLQYQLNKAWETRPEAVFAPAAPAPAHA
jgi:hypothetical protein